MIGLKQDTAVAAGQMAGTNPAPQGYQLPVPVRVVHEYDAAQTATFTTDVVDLGVGGTMSITETVANVAGTTPTLTTSVLTSADNGVNDAYRAAFDVDSGATSYATAILGNMPQLTANSSAVRRFVVDRYVKFTHTIGGSAGQTFDITLDCTMMGL